VSSNVRKAIAAPVIVNILFVSFLSKAFRHDEVEIKMPHRILDPNELIVEFEGDGTRISTGKQYLRV